MINVETLNMKEFYDLIFSDFYLSREIKMQDHSYMKIKTFRIRSFLFPKRSCILGMIYATNKKIIPKFKR